MEPKNVPTALLIITSGIVLLDVLDQTGASTDDAERGLLAVPDGITQDQAALARAGLELAREQIRRVGYGEDSSTVKGSYQDAMYVLHGKLKEIEGLGRHRI